MPVHSVLAAVIGSNKKKDKSPARSDSPPLQPPSGTPSRAMFPPTDPDDPTDQPWAGRKSAPTSPKVANTSRRPSNQAQNSDQFMTRIDIKAALAADKGVVDEDPAKRKKSLWDLIALTISMAGAQVAWTLELG